jgi:hypothetical protein
MALEHCCWLLGRLMGLRRLCPAVLQPAAQEGPAASVSARGMGATRKAQPVITRAQPLGVVVEEAIRNLRGGVSLPAASLRENSAPIALAARY